jgi:molecular chaperone DnaJ
MPEKRDYYQVLEVPRDASSEDLRRAYRRLAKQYHPDVNKEPGAEERFKEINEAYAILSDDERRAAYDRYGHAGVQGVPADFGINPFDIFEQFFGFGMGGGRRSRRAPHRGADLRYDQSLSFEESVFGVEKEIAFTRQDTCPACNGSGAEPGTTPIRCKACNGAGEVRQVRQTFLGSMVNVTTCPTCGGAGETVETPCRGCRGTGQQRAEIKRVVPVPAGVDDGTQIRMSAEGEPGLNGGPRGDLYIILRVKPHRFFRRREDDILLDVSINVAQAALGAKITVPTVDGDETVSVPSGTQSGRVLRLKGKGVPHVRRTGRGDQLVILSVEVPRTLTKEQRELFEQLAATLESEARPQEKSFLDSLKDLFGGTSA